jgi:hypothetical protein
MIKPNPEWLMVAHNLAHLVQPEPQEVWGPIQDDEALLLFALIRTVRMRRILEVGGLHGYSATNFLAAMGGGEVYTIDLNPVPSVGPGHTTIQKDIAHVTAADLCGRAVDLVFFDCHVFEAQIAAFRNLRAQHIITDATYVAIHDTGLHPRQFASTSYAVSGGWVHQPSERQMVNELHRMGYDAISFHTTADAHGPHLPFRHGLTLLRMFRPLEL